MSSGMFRGKESSNRIELSRLVQDLLNFGVLGSLRLWGGGRWMGGHLGAWGVFPHTCTHTHMHTHTHAHTCTHAHLYMYRNCKWPPTWRHPCLVCLTCMCMCVCMRVHACVCVHAWDNLSIHPYPLLPPSTHLPPPRGVDPRNHLKFNNTSTYQDISILFEDLESVKNSPSMGGCEIWWVHGWLGGSVGGVWSNH